MRENKCLLAMAAVVFVSGLSATSAPAQVRTVWLNEFNGPMDVEDVGTAVSLDSQANVIVVGWSKDTSTGLDSLVVKYDRTGKLLWSRTYDGPAHGDESTWSVLIDANDNIYVTGTVSGGANGVDYLILKYDSAGTLLWDQIYDGPGHGDDYTSGFGAATVDDLENVYITGSSPAGDGHNEFATIKYKADGTVDWVRRYTGPNPNSPDSYGWVLNLAPSGSLYVAGAAKNNGGGSTDYTLLKYDTSGNLIWERQFDGTYGLADLIYAMALDPTENIYMTGISQTAGGYEYCLAKFAPDGTFQWEARYGGTVGYHYGWIIDVDDSGNSYVSGASMTGGGEYDIVTVKFDTNGVLQWSRRYRDNRLFGEDWAYYIKVGPDGNIYVTGYIWKWFVNGFDAVTLKYDPAGTLIWDEVYNGSAGGDDAGFGLTIDDDLNVYVTGITLGVGTGADALTIKYSQSPAPDLAVSPDPLIAGQTGTFTVTNFEPLTTTHLAYSLVGTGETFVPMLNVALNLKNPQQAGASLETDASGSVEWNLPIPPDAAGLDVWFQAAQYNQVTNVVATNVQ